MAKFRDVQRAPAGPDGLRERLIRRARLNLERFGAVIAEGPWSCPWPAEIEALERGEAWVYASWELASVAPIVRAVPQTWWRLTENDELVQVAREDFVK